MKWKIWSFLAAAALFASCGNSEEEKVDSENILQDTMPATVYPGDTVGAGLDNIPADNTRVDSLVY